MAAAQNAKEATMPKLTDTQLVILSAAANREDRAVLPLPRSLKIRGAAITKTLESLLKKGLLDENPASREAEAWREDKDGRRTMLMVTEAGIAALDGEPANKPGRAPHKKSRGRAGAKSATNKTNGTALPQAVRAGTKQALLIDLLKRKDGATIDDVVEALGWQAHSVRGAISGGLKKKLGLAVSSEKVDGRGRVYRIAERG